MYLFINPIGDVCYHTEQQILKLVESSTEKVRFRFIPLLNMESVQAVMEQKKIPQNDLAARNQLVTNIYHAALDFKAALFQGKKRGRNFLLSIQRQAELHDGTYSDEIALQAARESNLDLEMFLNDRNSEFAARSFMKDQRTAAEMMVTHHPTVVLYNVKGYDCGIALDACQSYKTLKEVFAGQVPTGLNGKDHCHKTQINSFLQTNQTPLKLKINSNNH
ncbi:DsbA family protein [Ligilactobacillus salitolerans]|nr:DsbA family protein [Ligilactobacillus salitolerans]